MTSDRALLKAGRHTQISPSGARTLGEIAQAN
jgi:hypothetical protein